MRDKAHFAPATMADYEMISLIGSGVWANVYSREDQQLHSQVALKIVRRGWTRRHHRASARRTDSCQPDPSQHRAALRGAVTQRAIPYSSWNTSRASGSIPTATQKKLTIPERLRLFAESVQRFSYAHQHPLFIATLSQLTSA